MSKRTVRLTESELKSITTESVKNIISELDWKTKVYAANKAHKQARDKIYITGEYGPQDGRYYKRGRFVNGKEETERRLKQANSLSKYANECIKQEFGKGAYYNDSNGIGN